jgi:RimJ/RimL family protein N-acetyltransferase
MLIVDAELTIRNVTVEDASLLCKWWNDGQVMAHAGFPLGLGVDVKTIIDKIATETDDTCHRLILEVFAKPIGEMSYRNKENAIAEIGIKICEEEMKNKGYGTKFIKMLIQELFIRGYEKIILDANLNNTRAQHFYEKIGFTRVGIRRDSWMDQLGVFQSSVDYELIRVE